MRNNHLNNLNNVNTKVSVFDLAIEYICFLAPPAAKLQRNAAQNGAI
jgi:hypothetical protein